MWNFFIGFFCGIVFVCTLAYLAFFFGGLDDAKYNEEFGPGAASRIDSSTGDN